jgi:hypothetical protein
MYPMRIGDEEMEAAKPAKGVVWCLVCVILLSGVRITTVEADSINANSIADAQCMVVGARLSESPNPRLRFSGEMLLSYFLGRIDGRSPHVDLEGLIEREAKKMTATDLRNAVRRCGTEFSARGAQITRIGKDLERSGK